MIVWRRALQNVDHWKGYYGCGWDIIGWKTPNMGAEERMNNVESGKSTIKWPRKQKNRSRGNKRRKADGLRLRAALPSLRHAARRHSIFRMGVEKVFLSEITGPQLAALQPFYIVQGYKSLQDEGESHNWLTVFQLIFRLLMEVRRGDTICKTASGTKKGWKHLWMKDDQTTFRCVGTLGQYWRSAINTVQVFLVFGITRKTRFPCFRLEAAVRWKDGTRPRPRLRPQPRPRLCTLSEGRDGAARLLLVLQEAVLGLGGDLVDQLAVVRVRVHRQQLLLCDEVGGLKKKYCFFPSCSSVEFRFIGTMKAAAVF